MFVPFKLCTIQDIEVEDTWPHCLKRASCVHKDTQGGCCQYSGRCVRTRVSNFHYFLFKLLLFPDIFRAHFKVGTILANFVRKLHLINFFRYFSYLLTGNFDILLLSNFAFFAANKIICKVLRIIGAKSRLPQFKRFCGKKSCYPEEDKL